MKNLSSNFLAGASLFACAGALLAGCQSAGTSAAEGTRITPVYSKQTGVLQEIVADRKGDGRVDVRAHMNGARVTSVEIDRNRDGRPDRWEYYEPSVSDPRGGGRAVLVRAEEANGDSARVTRWEYFEHGVIRQVEEDTNGDGRVDKWESYEGGTLRRMDLDLAGRGFPDQRLVYRDDGTFDHTESDPAGDGRFKPADLSPGLQVGQRRRARMTTLQLDDVQVGTPATVLLLSTGARDRSAVAERLSHMGVAVTRVSDAGDALRAVAAQAPALCVIDLADEGPAIASIRTLRAQHAGLVIAAIVDPARPIAAAEAIHAGASDLLPWPLELRDLAALVADACDGLSVSLPSAPTTWTDSSDRLVAQSPAMRHVMDLVGAAADGRGGVLIHGEASTGRELAARAIHARSTRASGPFVVVDYRQRPADELEMELFGVPADRQTGGAQRQMAERIAPVSAVYRARGGTLFLANIIDAPSRTQAKLARLIRDREAALADKRTIVDLDLRPIATLESSPDAAVHDGRLRRDLYERLAHSQIEMPAFRRRREDIPLLVGYFLREAAEATGAPAPRFTRSALALLSALPWSGNGRELRSVLDALLRRSDRSVIGLDDVLEHVHLSGSAMRVDPEGTLREAKMRFERDWISATLIKHHGRVGDAARALGIQRTNLYRKVRQLKVARTLLSRKA